ncbi:MAG: ABC transporter permease [Verrucomicrobia bacterium]|nr:ABC transporter permease [Verrucomicrobiota bacterium]
MALAERAASFVTQLGGMVQLTSASLVITFTRPPKWREITRQMFNFGVQSAPVVLLTGAATGAILALQMWYQMRQLGMVTAIGPIVSLSMANELGPLLTGIMVAARMGAAMAAELGTMRVTEQIDALRSLAVDPVRYLVVPRLIAGLVMIPLLTAFSIAIGILGGYIVAVHFKGVQAAFYWANTIRYTQASDVWVGIIKSAVFAVIIVIVACYKGFNTSGGAEGVGKATTGTVVVASVSILISDFFLTNILF